MSISVTRQRGAAVLASIIGMALAGCASTEMHFQQVEKVDRAVAVIHPTEGSNAKGVVHFSEVDDGVRVVADLENLEPNAKHGFHIHQYGDCSALDATSAGGHYDPDGSGFHAMPNAEAPHHAGDLGNVEADGAGKAHYDMVIRNISIAGKKNPIIGRAVIIHAKADTFVQPTGAAGGRIGCGVIGIAKPGDG